MQTHTTTIDTGLVPQRGGRGGGMGELVGAASSPPADRAIVTGRLLTADEVAAVLGVPRTFVYSLARRGELPTVRIGERYVRFRGQALDRWISEQESTRPKGTQ